MTSPTSRSDAQTGCLAVVLALTLGLGPGAALAQDPVLVPELPRLAPAGAADPADDLKALRGAALPAAPLPDATQPPDGAAPAAADPAPSARLGAQDLARVADALSGSTGRAVAEEIAQALGKLDIATLSAIARMSPRDAEALSRHVLAPPDPTQGGTQAASAPARTETTEAPAAKPAPAAPGVLIQAASFQGAANARNAVRMLAEIGLPAEATPTRAGGLHRLLVGPIPRAELGAVLSALADAGFADAFVVPR